MLIVSKLKFRHSNTIFSSQFHILALASVIRRPIFSVYLDIPGITAIRNAMHGVQYLRDAARGLISQ